MEMINALRGPTLPIPRQGTETLKNPIANAGFPTICGPTLPIPRQGTETGLNFLAKKLTFSRSVQPYQFPVRGRKPKFIGNLPYVIRGFCPTLPIPRQGTETTREWRLL
ncbi:conserved protein of unknown function [Limnospira indica PCC 8005]|uniref:Uncharacterized protein n=1 Tax=Limnospira indica PCC 8005 TaxID=376219 RepID=A0A9P1KJR5_9CYAN|nr:conserved protein of unknown function [Limnospira indica PCC 8005]